MSFINKKQLNSRAMIVLIVLVISMMLMATFNIAGAQDDPTDPNAPTEQTEIPPADNPPADDPTATDPPPTESPTEDSTETPTEEATDEVTETPTEEATDEVTETATEEATDEVTETATEEATDEVTETPTEEAPPTTTNDVFVDDFEDGDTEGWLFSAEVWQVVAEDGNHVLTSGEPGATAAIANIGWQHVTLSARLRVDPVNEDDPDAIENLATIAIRAGADNYTVTLNSSGHAQFFRSGVLFGESTVPLESTNDWHTVVIQAIGSAITVSVDGVAQVVFNDPIPLPAGMALFGVGANNTGAVAIDDVNFVREDAPVIVPIPETEPTDVIETPSPDPTEEVTDEPTEEVIDEPTEEVTDEPTEEVIDEADESITVILSADFEGELVGWLAGEGTSIISNEDEGNSALFMAAGSSMLPLEAVVPGDFQLDLRVNIAAATDEAGTTTLNIPFRTQNGNGYVLAFSDAETTLQRNDENGIVTLISSPIEQATDTWHSLRLVAESSSISVNVDDTTVLVYLDEAPLLDGSLALIATDGAGLTLDDVVVSGIAVEELVEELVEEPLEVVAEVTEPEITLIASKLDGTLHSLLELYLTGDTDGALALAQDFYYEIDGEGKLSVILWAAQDSNGSDLAELVDIVGGQVDFEFDDNVSARIAIDGLISLATSDVVAAIRQPAAAASTDRASAPVATGSGNVVPHTVDIIGVNDWFNAGITGSGINVGIIDTGFNGADKSNGNQSCLNNNTAVGGNGSSNHGVNVIEIICDIAPNATVRTYRAAGVAAIPTFFDALSAAEAAGNDVIVIAMDLGASASPGDGTGGTGSGNISNIYNKLADLHDNDVIVIASAGNSGDNYAGSSTRYISFDDNAGQSTIPLTGVSSGDIIHVSWNNWGLTSIDFTINTSGGGGSCPNIRTGSTPRSGPPSQSFVVPGSCDADFSLQLTSIGGDPFVQVQIIGSGSINTGSANVTPSAFTGTLARPADSPDVITVGAVCSSQFDYYPIMPTSSFGPIFATGGNQPAAPGFPLERNEIKPDLAGPAHTNTMTSSTPTGCTTGVEPTNGFNGTSSASAHVAGMAALMLSNGSMSLNTFDEVLDYLQSHAMEGYTYDFGTGVDAADGFDFTYGAGLSVLGDPNYNLNQVANLGTANIANPLGGNNIYVSLANMDSQQLGTAAQPYTSIPFALSQASSNDRIIVNPGEYVSSFGIDNTISSPLRLTSFDAADTNFVDPTRIWVNDRFTGNAGIVVFANVAASVDDISVVGFEMQSANLAGLGGLFTSGAPSAFHVSDADNVTFQDNSIEGFSVFSRILNSEASTLFGNTFDGNGSTGNGESVGVLAIHNSGLTTPILVEQNHFTNNTVDPIGTAQNGVLEIGFGSGFSIPPGDVDNASGAEVFNNRFINNSGESVVRVQNSPNSDGHEVVLAGNLFESNTQTGPVVHLDGGPAFRFINNTVVNNTNISNNLYGAIITRGNPGSNTNGGGEWEIHNNVISGNGLGGVTLPAGMFQDVTDTLNCDSIDNPAFNDDEGAQHNWIFPAITTGECINALNNVIFENIFDDTTGAFAGVTVDPNNPFRLRPVFDGTAIAVPGIDTGDNSFIPGGVTFDNRGDPKNRIIASIVDRGAYELEPPDPVDFIEGPLSPIPEDTLAFSFVPQATGGFGSYDFEVLPPFPTNYSTNPSNACGGASFVYNSVDNLVTYCPPQDFYSIPGGQTIDDHPAFNIRVTDRFFGSIDTGIVTLPISEVQNDTLTTVSETVNFVVDDPFNVFLKPFVQFENFTQSAPVGFPPVDGGADYPFTYSYVNVTGDPGLFEGGTNATVLTNAINAAQAATGNSHGLLSLNPVDGMTGTVTLTYQTQDDTAATVNNTMIINIVSRLASPGLYDDTDLQFDFPSNPLANPPVDRRTGWISEFDPSAINNTLHVSTAKNTAPTSAGNEATIEILGDSFVLHMIGEKKQTKAGTFRLDIDPDTTTGPGFVPYTSSGASCTVGAVPLGGGQISNLFKQGAYTIICTGIPSATTNAVRITTLDNKTVTVDAIEVFNSGGPLLEGFHDVDHPTLAAAFGTGWTTTITNDKLSKQVNKKASNRLVQLAEGPGASNVEFDFTGSIVALETVIEKGGAIYDFCVTPDGGTETCQTFNNDLGSGKNRIFNVFRPFSGLDPNGTHHVRITLTGGGQLIIDGVHIGYETPTQMLALDTEVDVTNLSALLFNGGTVFGKKSVNIGGENWQQSHKKNKQGVITTLATIPKKGVGAGPFLQFVMPPDATTIRWVRDPNPKKDSRNIIICVDRNLGLDATANCITVDLKTAPNPLDITEASFGSTWSGTTEHTVEIFSLTDDVFNFDSIQVSNGAIPLIVGGEEEAETPPSEAMMGGVTLTEGFYDEDVAYDLSGQLILTGAWSPAPVATKKAFGGNVAETIQLGDTAGFTFDGTGFGVFFRVAKNNADITICYEPADMSEPEICESLTTNNNKKVSNWQDRNGDRPRPKKGEQFGFSFYGLTDTVWDVTVTHDGGGKLQLDAVAVFDDPTVTLLPGFYDDAALTDVTFGPAELWTATTGGKKGPPKGPFDFSEHTSLSAGSLVQFTAEGNIITLYQSAGKKNSAHVRFCMLDDTDGMDCSSFSQKGKKNFFAPIAFLGLGSGEYDIVLENRANGGKFSIDAIAILP